VMKITFCLFRRASDAVAKPHEMYFCAAIETRQSKIDILLTDIWRGGIRNGCTAGDGGTCFVQLLRLLITDALDFGQVADS
jgi:hypothetical protein